MLVLYAPDLGVSGLDYTDIISRDDGFCRECGSNKEEIDEAIVFYPEIVFYKVFSITVGMSTIFGQIRFVEIHLPV